MKSNLGKTNLKVRETERTLLKTDGERERARWYELKT
jgi:hypothetical protein